MKLSELCNKPFKVKGGGTLNLKGFSKHIIDKELGGGEITPESITPEMLENNDFQQRIRLWGHTVEEVEQLIADGKCLRVSGTGFATEADEDARYSINNYIFFNYGTRTEVKVISPEIKYILIAANDINMGLLLKRTNPHYFTDILYTFEILLDDHENYVKGYIGYTSI